MRDVEFFFKTYSIKSISTSILSLDILAYENV